MKAFFVALFLAGGALAQPVVGPEAATTPLTGLGDVAIAPQRDGFVLAWDQKGRIHTGHLDATLHLTNEPFEVPLFDPLASAYLPAVASNGTSVMVAWHERRPGYGEMTYVAILSADARTLLRGPEPINFTTDRPLLTTVAGDYVIFTGDLRYRYDENLRQKAGVFIQHQLAAALARNGDVGTVKESFSGPLSCTPVCFGRPCNGPLPDCTVTMSVTFTLPSRVAVSNYAFAIPAFTSLPLPGRPPLIGANGDSFAGLLQLNNRTDIWLFGHFEQLTLPVIVNGEASLEGNGSDVLVVWSGQPLKGMIFHPDGTSSEPFPIANTGYRPQVMAINSTEFAVLYRYDVDADRSVLAGRIVHLNPAKRRATR